MLQSTSVALSWSGNTLWLTNVEVFLLTILHTITRALLCLHGLLDAALTSA